MTKKTILLFGIFICTFFNQTYVSAVPAVPATTSAKYDRCTARDEAVERLRTTLAELGRMTGVEAADTGDGFDSPEVIRNRARVKLSAPLAVLLVVHEGGQGSSSDEDNHLEPCFYQTPYDRQLSLCRIAEAYARFCDPLNHPQVLRVASTIVFADLVRTEVLALGIILDLILSDREGVDEETFVKVCDLRRRFTSLIPDAIARMLAPADAY